MDSMYLPPSEAYNGLRTIDVNKLVFRHSWMDIQKAAKAKKGKRSDFIKTEVTPVYPDTTVWIKDFAYSYNEPMHNDYFWHQAYGDYPVVGVNWKQAKAFCAWRTLNKKAFIKAKQKCFSEYQNGYITSNSHGISFFDNVIKFWDNPDAYYVPKDKNDKPIDISKREMPRDDYEYNFIRVLKFNKEKKDG